MEEYSDTTQGLLPTDILIEVFCRLPVKTLVQFCCVCKLWKNLIRSDQNFIRCHLKQSLKKTSRSSSKVLMYSDRNTISATKLYDAVVHLGGNTAPSPTLHVLSVPRFINANVDCLRKSFFLGTEIYLVGCIYGIFCFYEGRDYDLYLWNPALHQCRNLPRSSNYNKRFKALGFFFDPTNDDYVVVKIITDAVHIYNLSSDSWKTIKFLSRPPTGNIVHVRDKVAVVHNGALHWISYFPEIGGRAIFLHTFDLSRKKFRATLLSSDLIPLAPFGTALGLFRGCLCLFGRCKNKITYEAWTMKEYGVENSWTKQFEFPIDISPGRNLFRNRTNGKFAVRWKDHIVLYDPESEEIEFVQDEAILYDENMHYFFADNYVESLVSVNPPDGKTQESTTDPVQFLSHISIF